MENKTNDHEKDDSIAVVKSLKLLTKQLRELNRKADILMSQLDDLNKAISDEDVEIQDLLASITKIDADVDALLAKIAAGGTTLPDITAQLTAIASHTAALTTGAQQLKDEDVKANPPTPAA